MVPYHNPIPEQKQRDQAEGNPVPGKSKDGFAGGGMMTAWIQAEKMMQIALVLPCAAFLGWLAGSWADRRLHQSWMTVVGILFGSASGLIYAIRMAIAAERSSDLDQPSQDRTGLQGESRKDSQNPKS